MKTKITLLLPLLFAPTLAWAGADSANLANPPSAQLHPPPSSRPAPGDGLWVTLDRGSIETSGQHRWLQPEKVHAFTLDHHALQSVLGRVPHAPPAGGHADSGVMTLPMPDGNLARFRVVEAPVMEPELAAKFPNIQTYSAQGLDNPLASARIDHTPSGFRAQIRVPGDTIWIEPLQAELPDRYVSFHLRDLASPAEGSECHSPGAPLAPASPPDADDSATLLAAAPEFSPAGTGISVGQNLRVFRLAVAATGEFTALWGGTVEGALAEIVSFVNRLNAIFEQDLAIRLVLVGNNDRIIFTNPATDPFSNFSNATELGMANQNVIDTAIGTGAYDVGHVFHAAPPPGGATPGSGACSATKAQAATIWWSREAAYRAVGLAGHELGHQFGARHSWNGIGCGSEWRSADAYEVGSGSTLMGYATKCGGTGVNLQADSDLYFHSGSFDVINAFVTTGGGRCGVLIPTRNNPPVVSAGASYSIPRLTPFALTASGFDPDGDVMTYCWEERDLGPVQLAAGPGSEDNGSSPLFRSFPPTTNSTRSFPRLSDLLNDRTTIGEQSPRLGRTMNFRVTARDQRTGVSGADMKVTVRSNAGPFRLLSPSGASIWAGRQTVLWDVAGTTNAPVSVSQVTLLLSTNGGIDFPIVLAANTPNDGSEEVSLPDVYAPLARIKVGAIGNIFFDVSRTNFVIVPAQPILRGDGAMLVGEACSPGNGAIDSGENVTVEFALKNIGAGAASQVQVELLLTGGVLAPGNAQAVGPLAGGGTRMTNRFSFSADPALRCGDTLIASLRVSDGPRDLGTFAYPFRLGTLQLNSTTFANTNAIIGPLDGRNSLYPSVIVVSNVPGDISHATVTLSNVTHDIFVLLDAVLVGPSGQAVRLVSDAFSIYSVNNATFTVDDSAPFSLLEEWGAPSGSYQPTDSDAFPDLLLPPAPEGPFAKRLSAFNGTNPNGAWRLFAVSFFPDPDLFEDKILGGWSLNLTTSIPRCCSPNKLRLELTDTPDPVALGSNLVYTIALTNSADLDAPHVVVTNVLPAGVTFVSVIASQGTCSHLGGVVNCALNTLTAGASATIRIEVTPLTSGLLTNQASVVFDGPDGAFPNTVAAVTTVNPARAFRIDDIQVQESDIGTVDAVFTVILDRSDLEGGSVRFTTVAGTATAGADFVLINGLLTFGPQETIKTITVKVRNDLLPESPETFFVTLTSPSNAVLGAASQAVATILDDDPTVLISSTTVTEGNRGTTRAAFVIGVSNLSSKTVTVSYVTSNNTATAGTDYAAQSGSITFRPGLLLTTVNVTVGGDTVPEDSETFFLLLNQPANAALATNLAVGTILNDDGLIGQVDHFVWSALGATQYVELPFAATLTALDADSHPVSSFRGPVSLSAFGDPQDVTIGTNATTWVYPMFATSHDARLQSIYLASEIGGAARIMALALDVAATPDQTLSNWTVRLKHTTLTNYSLNAWEGVGWTLVYQTNLSVTSNGWLTFPFSTPFDYDGTSSLMVDFSFNNASSSTAGQCRYFSVSQARSVFGGANSTAGDPLSWSGAYPIASSGTPRLPSVRLTVRPAVELDPPESGGLANGIWTGEIVLSQAVSSVVLQADDRDGHTASSVPFAVAPPPDSDSDGLPDPWEVRYFGVTDAPRGGPNDDADADGVTNRDEFLAGTDPTDAASLLRLTARLSGGDVRLRFTGRVGKRYRVERAGDLNASSRWEAVPEAENLKGVGSEIEVLDSGAVTRPQRFYRVKVN